MDNYLSQLMLYSGVFMLACMHRTLRSHVHGCVGGYNEGVYEGVCKQSLHGQLIP